MDAGCRRGTRTYADCIHDCAKITEIPIGLTVRSRGAVVLWHQGSVGLKNRSFPVTVKQID